MDDNLSIGMWENEASPEQMMNFSERKLRWVMKAAKGQCYDEWARAELARRRDEFISDLIRSLTDANIKVHREVTILNSSSKKLEDLTKTLKNLTWILIVLTTLAVILAALALIVPFGIHR
jgi:hypothetical protein